MLDERLPLAPHLHAELDHLEEAEVAANAAAAAVLKLEMRARDLPAIVLAADQVLRRDPHIFEVDRVLPTRSDALGAIAQQLHRFDRDPGQVGWNHEPRQILVTFPLTIGSANGQE